MRVATAIFLTVTAWSAGYDADPMHVAATSPIRRLLLVPTEAAHGGEVTARDGEQWLALTRTPGGYKTEMVNLRITAVPDPLGEVANDRTGKRVGLQQSANPVFLLSGYAHLRDRNIRTSFDGNFKLVPHLPVSFHFAGRKVELQLQPNGKLDVGPGDLDGDGKVDLLSEDQGYNWSSLRLFLSTAAKPGRIVGEVGQFYQTGC